MARSRVRQYGPSPDENTALGLGSSTVVLHSAHNGPLMEQGKGQMGNVGLTNRHLLLAHVWPWIDGSKQALREFVGIAASGLDCR